MKAKQFQRIGPITLSLRRADTKHKNYDIEMIVDDNQMGKKKVNLATSRSGSTPKTNRNRCRSW